MIKAVLKISLVFLLSLPLAAVGAETEFPKSPVKLVVPFPPGGPTDTMGRIVGAKLQELWGQAVVLEYKPGAGTVIGTDAVAKSAPDGYTIGMVNSAFGVNPVYRKTLPFDTTRDLAGVTQMTTIQIALVAYPGAPFNTMAELIAYARRNPGKLSFATPGAGATSHLAGELLKRAAGIDMVHVPYKGSSPAQTDLIAGRVDLMFDPFFSALPFVKAGKLKVIALNGERRVAGYTQYPVVAETYPGFNVTAMLGLVVPAATPRAIVRKIRDNVASVLNAPAEKKRIEELGMEVVASTPEQFDAFVQGEINKWGKVIREAGIQPE